MSVDVEYLSLKKERNKKIESDTFRGRYKRHMLAENLLILKQNDYIYHWNRFQEKKLKQKK